MACTVGITSFNTASPADVGGARSVFRHHVLRQSQLFNTRTASFLEEVVQELSTELFRPGDVIIRQGDVGDKMYFLYNGEAEVVELSGLVHETKVEQLEPGAIFGEAALLEQLPHPTSVRAVSACDCRSIRHETFEAILQRYPEDQAFFEKLAQERMPQLKRTASSSSSSLSASTSKKLCSLKSKLIKSSLVSKLTGSRKRDSGDSRTVVVAAAGCCGQDVLVKTAVAAEHEDHDDEESSLPCTSSFVGQATTGFHEDDDIETIAVPPGLVAPKEPSSLEPGEVEQKRPAKLLTVVAESPRKVVQRWSPKSEAATVATDKAFASAILPVGVADLETESVDQPEKQRSKKASPKNWLAEASRHFNYKVPEKKERKAEIEKPVWAHERGTGNVFLELDGPSEVSEPSGLTPAAELADLLDEVMEQ